MTAVAAVRSAAGCTGIAVGRRIVPALQMTPALAMYSPDYILPALAEVGRLLAADTDCTFADPDTERRRTAGILRYSGPAARDYLPRRSQAVAAGNTAHLGCTP